MQIHLQRQASRNAETRDAWNCFRSHRQRVTQCLCQAATESRGGKLCVLGAGNCNDLALDQLATVFDQIELIDLDESAVMAGIARQGVDTNRITVRGGIDVTGAASHLSAWKPDDAAADEQVDACLAHARQASLPIAAESCCVAASTCLLSQLIETVTTAVKADHPRFLDLITCIRQEHLRRLVELVMPGGSVVLITDVVSSVTLPELATAASGELPALVGHAIAARNFFTGVNPFILQRMLETELPFAAQLTEVHLSNPWIWDLGPRLYAVCALTAKRI